MPPTTRRAARLIASAPPTPPPAILQFSLFGPTHLPISPPIRRVHSASASPYPTSRQAITEARNSSRNADTTRRVLGELDWWVRMSGQVEEEEEEYEYEEEGEEWETMPEDEAQAGEDNESSAPVDVNSHNDNDDDDTISEHSEPEAASVHSDASTLSGYEMPDFEHEPPEVTRQRSASLLFFPTSFPPLANLLSTQVGQEPSRRAPSRPYATRNTSSLTWDYSTSSMVITSSNSATPISPPPSPGRPPICRTSPRRASSVSPGSVADNIIRETLALTSPPPTPGPTKTNLNFLPIKKFPINLLMTSPSIMTFR